MVKEIVVQIKISIRKSFKCHKHPKTDPFFNWLKSSEYYRQSEIGISVSGIWVFNIWIPTVEELVVEFLVKPCSRIAVNNNKN